MPKTKSLRQVRYLLSSGSPLSSSQKSTLKGELHSGAVKVTKRRSKRRTVREEMEHQMRGMK
jgi:hypothetical protein